MKNPSPRILAQAVCLYLGIDPERVFEPCRRATGSITEACRMLLRNMEPGGAGARATRPDDIPPRVAEVIAMLQEGWRPESKMSGRTASAHDEEGARDAPRHPPLRLLLLYISPPSYTLGIRGADGAYIPIGKVDSLTTLPRSERAALSARIKGLVVERFGPTSMLKPEIVVEVSYSGILPNKRTKAGFTLNDAAIIRVLDGADPADITLIDSLL